MLRGGGAVSTARGTRSQKVRRVAGEVGNRPANLSGENELHFLFLPGPFQWSSAVDVLSRLNAPYHGDAQGCPVESQSSEITVCIV
jgi:hypothetical protein